jgi:hypothetical protein
MHCTAQRSPHSTAQNSSNAPSGSLGRRPTATGRGCVQNIEDAEDFMDALNVDDADVLWGTAHVLSRAHGSEKAPALVPALDLLNHSAHAMPPVTCALPAAQ